MRPDLVQIVLAQLSHAFLLPVFSPTVTKCIGAGDVSRLCPERRRGKKKHAVSVATRPHLWGRPSHVHEHEGKTGLYRAPSQVAESSSLSVESPLSWLIHSRSGLSDRTVELIHKQRMNGSLSNMKNFLHTRTL